MKKPNIEDYGIIENEFEKYKQYREDKDVIENTNIVISCILFIVVMIVVTILVVNGTKLLMSVSYGIKVDYSIFPLKGADIIAYIIVSYPICSARKKSQLKKIEKTLRDISTKHIERMAKYYNDIKEYQNYIDELQEKEELQKTKISTISHLINKVNSIEFNKLTTEDLKKCMWDLYENNLQEDEESLFDFSLISSNINIVCFGVDDNISKIEIKQFLDYVKETNEKIFIYSINEIDNKSLTNNSKIKIINAEKLKKSFLDKYNDEIENV